MGFKSIEIEGIRMRRSEFSANKTWCGVNDVALSGKIRDSDLTCSGTGKHGKYITRKAHLNASFYFLIKFDNRRYA
jgi:hypothetical protein